ncbi:MAG TPA: right-handed parallel beta-helix repeat-containing protein [Blastocatellia bacterium]|jgi:hypothetical protein|nr:right-handed parallel beta-helix repeat-containing protein [Blastocatellia bacterium]
MNGFRYTLKAVAVLLFTLTISSLAQAQATRTWVSGVGDDVNPCSRTAPCKTFAGAISKTAAGGEISALDPAGFGTITITKSITISGDGTLAGILAAGVNGVIVNAGVNDKVVLRNLSINGVGTGVNGIRYLAGKQLVVDKCTISGFTGNGIDVALAANGNLFVRDTHITNVNNGIRITTTGGQAVANIDNVHIDGATTNGLDVASNSAFATILNSTISSAGSNALIVQGGSGQINAENCMLTANGTGVNSSSNGAFIRISNVSIYNNTTGMNIGAGAVIASANNNKVSGNGGATVPNGTTPVQ